MLNAHKNNGSVSLMPQAGPSRLAASGIVRSGRLGRALLFLILFSMVLSKPLQAAISVGPTGTGTLTFDATPPIGEWSTLSVAGGAGDLTAAAALEADVIANLDAAAITTALGTSSTLPITANSLARRHTSQNWLQTPPTSVKYGVLMATLQNNSGSDLVRLDVSYDLGNNLQAGTTTVEEIPGHRVFYSQTGAPGSWAVATALSGGTAGKVSGTLNLGTWAQGAMLYLLWIDDNGSADRNNADNEEGGYTIDNWLAVGGTAGKPTVKALDGRATGFTLIIEDGTPPGDVNPGTVAAILNGQPITPSANKAGMLTTITYTSPTLLAPGSTNTLSVTLKHTGTTTMVIEQTFVVPAYTVLPTTLAATGVDTTKPGFRIYPYQSDGWETNTTQPNNLTWTEDQLAGLHGANIANLFQADAEGAITEAAVINYSGEAGTGTERGNFTNDVAFPGIPGMYGTTGNSAIEAVTFLYFSTPGTYRLGVNSDDGFRVTTGKNPRDRFALRLGEYDGGRGASDTLFDVVIEQAGYYPFRLLWENGNGELPGNQLNCEWFSVAPDGTKTLINDIPKPGAIRAYYSGPVTVFVKAYNPAPNAANVPISSVIQFMLGDGSANTVLGSSVKLWLNGSSVTPVVAKAAGTNLTIVTYDPPGDLAPEETNTVRLVFSDNASPAYSVTNDYQFFTAPTLITLIAIDEATQWRYDQSLADLGPGWNERSFDDSAWPLGPALLGAESGTTVEPIRTYMGLGTRITYYFRIHFNYSGPSGARLQLRHVLDDGAVFYLNGVEVHRFGLAAGATFDATTPFADHENRYEGPFLLPTAPLVQGDNVLAVEVHQTSTTSSDMIFGAALEAITSHLARTTVESVTPAPNATAVPRDATISLKLVDGTSAVQSGSVKLWVNGSTVTPTVTKPAGSGVTSISYNPGTSLPYGLPVNVKVEFTDNGPVPNTTTYEWSYTAALETLVLFAVDTATQWRYEVTGQDLGTAWKEPGYNDSAWPLGAALIADETGGTVEPIRTPVTKGNVVTFYFRHHFNYNRDLTGVTLQLRDVTDDGAVFYLNGVEVFRTDNMPTGLIAFDTLALVDHENVWRGPTVIPSSSLIQGENVFAVEVHQNSTTSSDAVFGAELKAIFTPVSAPPEFTVVTLEPGGLRIQWIGGGILEESDSPTGGWGPSPNQTNPQVIPTTAPRKFYRVKQ